MAKTRPTEDDYFSAPPTKKTDTAKAKKPESPPARPKAPTPSPATPKPKPPAGAKPEPLPGKTVGADIKVLEPSPYKPDIIDIKVMGRGVPSRPATRVSMQGETKPSAGISMGGEPKELTPGAQLWRETQKGSVVEWVRALNKLCKNKIVDSEQSDLVAMGVCMSQHERDTLLKILTKYLT